jgi:protein-S-isoprenylcysteine O-methyltransferase Ste14
MSNWVCKGFRQSQTDSILLNGVKALIETTIFWSFFLGVIPWGILTLQKQMAIPLFESPAGGIPAIVLFSIVSLMCLHSSAMFVIYGRGTPLPLDEPSRLVIRGLYRYVRNPMAMFGIIQGFSVGLYLGSWPVMFYAILGVPVWNYIARPPEERDLEARFGAEFLEYKANVRCWIPRLRPYG